MKEIEFTEQEIYERCKALGVDEEYIDDELMYDMAQTMYAEAYGMGYKLDAIEDGVI